MSTDRKTSHQILFELNNSRGNYQEKTFKIFLTRVRASVQMVLSRGAGVFGCTAVHSRSDLETQVLQLLKCPSFHLTIIFY
eukprot:UN28439